MKLLHIPSSWIHFYDSSFISDFGVNAVGSGGGADSVRNVTHFLIGLSFVYICIRLWMCIYSNAWNSAAAAGGGV